MATTIDGADTPLAVKEEPAESPPPPVSEHLTSIANQPSNTSPSPSPPPPPPPPQSQILETLPPCPSHFLNSKTEFKDLLNAISAFHQSYENVKIHLDSVKTAILTMLPSETSQFTQLTPSVFSPIPYVPNGESELQKPEDQIEPEQDLVDLCKTMCSRDVRKFIAHHLSNRPMLREKVPNALREAPNPPKLVLECLGKFFLQGSKSFSTDSRMILSREASIFTLECFLLMIGIDNNEDLNIEETVKEEADNAAIAWRERLISEGGVAKASQIDARGLLLFIACFGIPALFQLEDIRDLVIAANAKEIASVLQKSHILMSKISETIEEMLKKKTEVDAVDIVYTFGLEQKFNTQSILITFLRDSKETWKKTRKGPHGSSTTQTRIEANKMQLAALKYMCKCLERHKIDPAKLLPGWQIDRKMETLASGISTSGKKTLPQKRKPTVTETSQRGKSQETKRQRYRGQPHKGGASNHGGNRRNYMFNNYSAPQAVVYGGPGAGLLPPQTIVPQHSVPAAYGGAPHSYMWPRESQAVEMHYNYDYSNYSNSNNGQGAPVGVGLTSLYGPATTTSIEGFAGNIANNSSSLVGVGGVATGVGSGGGGTSDPNVFASLMRH